jgi:hypothetical protein
VIATTDDDLRAVLAGVRTIAVLGAHRDPERPAAYVPAYLHRAGFRILPINPGLVGEVLWGEPVVAALGELPVRPDLIDVFRPSGALAGHRDELIAAAPRAVWFQLGIRDDAVAAALDAAGIDVVQDACLKIEHRRLAAG